MDEKKIKAENIEQVAIFGSSHAKPDSELVEQVFEVCKQLAEAGYIVVNGGGPGVMRAATMGAKSVKGKVIGIVLEADTYMHYEGQVPKNKFDIEIKAKNYVERTLALMREGQVYVIFNGASGTMSEFSMAWGLARMYFGHHKPLILYGNFWKDIMYALRRHLLLRPEEKKVYKIVNSPEEVLRAIRKFEAEIQAGEHKHLDTHCEDGVCQVGDYII